MTLNTAAYEKVINEMKADLQRRKSLKAAAYKYEWNTVEDILANLHTLKDFKGGGKMTLAEISTDPADYRKAHELWLKLKDKFNAEAATYDPEAYDSELGSVGAVESREVLRSAWWDAVGGDDNGNYYTITNIIEVLHHGEMLETGRIGFGS